MFELKTNFYYPGTEVVDSPTHGVPASEAVEPTETTPTTPTTTATKKVEPRTRKEHYLAAIAGEDVTIPEPKTRQEYYLKEIAENGDSGGGGVLVCNLDTQTGRLDKTWQEIYSAPFAVIKGMLESGIASWAWIIGTGSVPDKDVYTVYVPEYDEQGAMHQMPLSTDSPDGFPAAHQS